MCEPCRAIAEGRHIDVIEMDAASHTGIDDIREIIEASRYAAVSARYKIYIIDEVHMLSKAAFNGLLKTLEEPPGHVKFLFATTEVNKVPVTVLSRCQRFDLKRISAEQLAKHFAHVSKAEGVEAEPRCARADRARRRRIGARRTVDPRPGDRARGNRRRGGDRRSGCAICSVCPIAARYASCSRNCSGAMRRRCSPRLRQQYDMGVDPAAVLKTLLETVHGVTLARLGADMGGGQAAEERAALAEWGGGTVVPRAPPAVAVAAQGA